MTATIRAQYEQVLSRITAAARFAGRGLDEVRLVVVTKTHPPATVQAAILAGARDLGENYAEEGIKKMTALSALGETMPQVRWHMIGHVQSRKAPLIARHFDLIHSLDGVKLAHRLNQSAIDHQRKIPVLLQLNVSGEESKSGLPAWKSTDQDALCDAVVQIQDCSHLIIQGLMTVPPYFDDPEQVRPYFRKLREWRELLARQFPQSSWHELSMGMSGDFEVAIQEGATLVRVGTAILGSRT